MKIYEQSVRKPISTILIFIGVIVLGIYSLRGLSVDMYPDIELPAISVITTYPGANAGDIETNITRILEDNLNTVSNLKKITSSSSDNYSLISLEMKWGSDMNEAANEIRDAVSRVESSLPDEANTPTIFKFSSSMMPVVVLTVTAEESLAALNKILDDKLVNVLNRIDGVGAVSMMGSQNREVQINVDPQRLEAYKLTIEQIAQVITQENTNIPSGTIDIGNNTYTLKADAQFGSSDELSEIIVANRMGKDIYLKDVAQIRDTLAKSTVDERINGERGVRVIVQKQSGSNTVQIAKAVFEALPAIQASLPSDIKLDVVMDGSESIQDSINSLTTTVMYAFIFVILVVLFFLGRWRATFIICLTIPISLITSFIYLYITGGTINIISLSSLSIAIGMVVDDAIVVLENITKHIERGSSPREASIYATNEVWLAVIATTLTVVAVFLPLTMVSGMAGIMFKQLGWIVSIVVVVSTIAAITLTPMLTSLMLKAQQRHSYKGLGVIFKPIDRFLDRLDIAYARMLAWALHHRTFVAVSSMSIFVASLFLLNVVPTDFFPASDNAIISARVDLQQNINVDYTAGVARRIEEIISEKYPEIYIVSASSGASEGSGMSAIMGGSTGSYIINFMMRLNKESERTRSIFDISDLLREDLEGIPEIRRLSVTPGGSSLASMGSGGSSIQVKIFGYDFNVTNEIANELLAKMGTIPGTRDVMLSRDDLQPEFNVILDRQRLAHYGLNSSVAGTFVRNRINGLVATKYREDGDEYDVRVRYAEQFRTSFEDINNITFYTPAGAAVRLADVSTIEEQLAPPAIERENRQRVIYINMAISNNMALSTVVERVDQVLAEYRLPEDVAISVGGTVEDQQESFGDIIILLVLIILLVYIVMATQFESFRMPFIIMFTMPFAFTGVFLALYLTGTTLSLIALIGAIMLVGIVVKNGIVIVDFTNLLRERGASINQAVVAAGKSRLRPVLMTSLTTILGMFPLAMGIGEGSSLWQPMGIAVIGGLTFSTLLTLLVIPVVYSIFGGSSLKKMRKQSNR